jgi:translocation and assembly module TamA
VPLSTTGGFTTSCTRIGPIVLLLGLCLGSAVEAQSSPERIETARLDSTRVDTTRAEPGRAEPVRVEIEGVSGDVERNVRAVLQIARAADAGDMTRDRIQRLHRRADDDITTALEPFGYYRPVVEGSVTNDGKRWVARYRIDPGPPVIVRTLDLRLTGEGANFPAFQKLAAEFPVHRGDTLRHLPYENGKLALLTMASDSGFLNADFDTSVVLVNRETSAADLVLRFETGPRFRFGSVAFHQSILDPEFLQTRIPFRRGELYQSDKLLELQTNLGEDPYFSRVEVIPRPNLAEGIEVPIDVELVPRKPQAFEAGAGYGTDTGPRGRFSAQLRRINRQGHNAEAELIVAPVEQSISTEYLIPAFGHPKGVLTFLAGYAILNPTTSNSKAILIGARLSRPRFGWRELFSLTYQREAFEVGVDTGTSNLFIPGGSWERTRSDSRIFPGHGLRMRLGLQGSAAGLLATASFLQIGASGKFIQSIGPRTRFITRAELGRTFTKEFRQLPPTLRYFAGGDQSVRGYGYQALGPLDEAGNVIGGPTLVVGSVEVDFRVLPRWAIAGFTDVGNALEDLSLDLEQGVGLGIRWISPIGLVRLDGALAVSQPGTPFRLHLSIGPDL